LVIVTHSHSDHFSTSTITAVSKSDAPLIVPQAVFNSLTATQKTRATVLGYGANVDMLGLNVAAVPAYNTNHPFGTGNGYVIKLGDRRIYVSGDTGDVPEVRALQDIDVAFVCMNVPFTMTVAQAASVVRDIQPGIVIPYHYRNQNNTFADLGSFKSQVGSDLGIQVRLLKWY
jgi:L-ascorbate metabolism protein UlaG (beta-lactamase superfamily)